MPASNSNTTSSVKKPTIVGLYGLPGSGKSYVLCRLKTNLGFGNRFQYYEGSEVIGNLVDGGLEAFKRLHNDAKSRKRQQAIQFVADECTATGRIGIVTGHHSFWNDKPPSHDVVWTDADMRVYTHIVYLDMPAISLWDQRTYDELRTRPDLQPHHLAQWKNSEIAALSRLSRLNGMHFMPLYFGGPHSFDGIEHMLRNIETTEEENFRRVRSETDRLLLSGPDRDQLDTVLVLDADRTLCAADTGSMFWERLKATSQRRYPDCVWDGPENFGSHWLWDDLICPLKRLFSENNDYSLATFHRAMSLYEYVESAFDEVCEEVAAAVSLYPEFMALIHAVKCHRGVGIAIATCGLRRIWKLILEREGLDDDVKIIGGGRFADDYVVTPEVKAVVVSHLQSKGVFVWAFGDSPVDLPMLKRADQAIVVVGEERFRSKTMDAELTKAITGDKNFRPRQALVPSHSSPRLDPEHLPIVDISGQAFVESLLHRYANLLVLHATNKSAAKLLMTATRDASVAGPGLRAAHGQVGRYLATEFLTELLGLETYPIPHVQGYNTDGHRLVDESRTAIVALMRGGEPMALGVSEVFPNAIFIHANRTSELTKENLVGVNTLLLVDSVVNSGKSIKGFVDRVRRLKLEIRIVIVAGVVQAKAISDVLEPLACKGDLSLVTLRLSDNKFPGIGGTDTGNRPFNTTHLN
ncbi:uracil phosphoribosyltransferase [Colletotrichum scovillei]|uniref:Uracil phosphoribosyltransferase n=1 Tax=Colletotrichum scovillei TaxID=1209932 RepID=A0A9P7UI86_9PEZI|nr:uracil phosphoribosyltransferase [Colletotrichum scovillei]KAG7076120.1 uracil phosphoribosyltransferase [Colletotrichum scovillei]KAG7083281.1 uracil phosphoribosyltransferase [Colletotrichum scovillei]